MIDRRYLPTDGNEDLDVTVCGYIYPTTIKRREFYGRKKQKDIFYAILIDLRFRKMNKNDRSSYQLSRSSIIPDTGSKSNYQVSIDG